MKKLIFILISLILPICAFSQSRPIIENLEANSTELYKIKLTWTLPSMPSPKIEKLYIYRDSKQITSYSQISSLNPIATLDKNSTFYIDNVQNTNGSGEKGHRHKGDGVCCKKGIPHSR